MEEYASCQQQGSTLTRASRESEERSLVRWIGFHRSAFKNSPVSSRVVGFVRGMFRAKRLSPSGRLPVTCPRVSRLSGCSLDCPGAIWRISDCRLQPGAWRPHSALIAPDRLRWKPPCRVLHFPRGAEEGLVVHEWLSDWWVLSSTLGAEEIMVIDLFFSLIHWNQSKPKLIS